jgi:hypothetical protein
VNSVMIGVVVLLVGAAVAVIATLYVWQMRSRRHGGIFRSSSDEMTRLGPPLKRLVAITVVVR